MARVVKDWFGPEAMRRYQVRFSKQVWPGDTLTFTATVTGKREEGGERPRRRRVRGDEPGRRRGAHRHRDGRRREAGTAGWDCSTAGSRSSPGRDAASAASSCCAWHVRARASSSTTWACRSTAGAPRRTRRRRCARRSRRSAGRPCPNYDSVTTSRRAERIVQTAVDAFGKIDILVNNAGIVRDRTLVKMSEEDFDAVIGVHLKGSFNCARHAAPLMKEAGYGRIINITSSAGLRGNFGQTNYGGGEGRAHGPDVRLGARARRVRRHGQRGRTGGRHAHDRRRCSSAPGPRPPPEQNPALNAPLVAFLASERAAHVNGQILGRTDYAYTLFQHPKQIAFMWRDGGWTPDRSPTTSTRSSASTSSPSAWSCPAVDAAVAATSQVLRWPWATGSASSTSSSGRSPTSPRARDRARDDGFEHIDVLDGRRPGDARACPSAARPRSRSRSPAGARRPRPTAATACGSGR